LDWEDAVVFSFVEKTDIVSVHEIVVAYFKKNRSKPNSTNTNGARPLLHVTANK